MIINTLNSLLVLKAIKDMICWNYSLDHLSRKCRLHYDHILKFTQN